MSNTRLGEALKHYCWQNSITTRDLAADWDCSHTTVARLINGQSISQETFIKALQWLTETVDEENK